MTARERPKEATWVADLTGKRQTGFLSAADARDALDPPSDEVMAMERIDTTVIPGTLDEMPKFWQFQLNSACGFLARDAEMLAGTLGDEDITAIRRRISEGVRALLDNMLEQDLLLAVEPIPASPCWDF